MQKSNLNKPLKFMANMLMPHEKVLSQDPEVEVAKTGVGRSRNRVFEPFGQQ